MHIAHLLYLTILLPMDFASEDLGEVLVET